MSLFTRMSDIVQANLNAMLDKAEDPQKVVRLIIQEMEETLVELRTITARHLAEQKTLDRRAGTLQKEAALWLHKAEVALAKDKEVLARAALKQKQSCLDALQPLAAQQAQIAENLAKLEEDAQRLHTKLAEAKHKEKALYQRQQTSNVQLKARHIESQYNVEDTLARFERYEQKIDEMDAKIEAHDQFAQQSSLEQEFQQLMQDTTLDDELAQLKAKQQNAA